VILRHMTADLCGKLGATLRDAVVSDVIRRDANRPAAGRPCGLFPREAGRGCKVSGPSRYAPVEALALAPWAGHRAR
jgi:hypothetical protein